MNKNIFVLIFAIFSIFFIQQCMAFEHGKAIVDVYGTKLVTAEMLQKSYGKQLQTLANYLNDNREQYSEKHNKKMLSIVEKLNNDINKMGSFAYLSLDTILYPKNPDVYFTLDIVEKTDIKRLSYFSPKPKNSFPDPDNLIQLWQQYVKIATRIGMETGANISFSDCPAFHCLTDMSDPKVKKYNDIFMANVPKNKDKLIQILREDKDEVKRASAAYLLAYIKDGNELIKTLVPAMHDSNVGVRNDAMRTLGGTLFKMKGADFPIQEAVQALDYPTTTDRNKALMILAALSDQTRYANYIKSHAATQLMQELKMQQLNLHNSAYEILKSISDKTYGDRDYAAWQKWLDSSV